MSSWIANAVALALLLGVSLLAGFALLWRVGAWRLSPAASLNLDEGLGLGTQAPQMAVTSGGRNVHLSFVGHDTFVAFGLRGCVPCVQLLEAAAAHPATKRMRRVYVTDDDSDLAPEALEHWEIYRFIEEQRVRERWRAPVSPYFHVIGPQGTVLAKGLANRPDHLDRLLFVQPAGLRRPTEFAVGKAGSNGGQ